MTTAWCVYGRTEYAEPLAEQGLLDDPSAGEVADRARAGFQGEWVELIAFPANAAHWIVRDGEEVEREPALRASG
jgi:hypothetical protein